MRRMAALLLAAVMATCVIGCGDSTNAAGGSTNSLGSFSNAVGGSNDTIGSSTDTIGNSADTVDGSANTVIYPHSGLAEGEIGNTMRTYWFDFTVNSAYLCDSFSGYSADDGNKILVVDITVTNTFGELLPMFDTDFWVEWNDEGDTYAFPVENASSLNSKILPSSYNMDADEIKQWLLLYEVPDGYTDFAIAYIEINESDETGDFFVVYFEPDQR